jgi:hypothetical protein
MYKPGADLSVPICGVDRSVEVKCRATGFRQLYEWIKDRDFPIVKADRQEPLVTVRLSLAAALVSTRDVASMLRLLIWTKREPLKTKENKLQQDAT